MRSRRLAALTSALAASTLVVVVAAPAAASGGKVDGEGNQYHLTNNWVASTDRAFAYGRDGDAVYVGDWNGDRVDTLAVRRGATYHLNNSLSGGSADRVLTYGRARDVVLVGDWDGDGRDTLGVRRGSTYHLKNSLRGGEADAVVDYGRARDEVIVGDWNGDGRDTLGVHRGNAFHIKNSISGGDADRVMSYGRARDGVLVGDWDGNRTDTIGLRNDRPARVDVDTPAGLSAFDQRMVELINVERSRAGVPAARAWAPLRDGALRHSSAMARTGEFEHASNGTIRADGVAAGCDASAENIFWGTGNYADDPEAVMQAYMDSPGHRANILARENRFVAAGTVEADNGRIYNTQRFARSCS